MALQAFNNIVSKYTKKIMSQLLEEIEKSMLNWEVLKDLPATDKQT